MKMKKVLAAALSLACASTLFAATAVTASAADKKEVVIWDYFETDAQKQMMQSLIDEFNASQDEYEASHVYVPFADYEKQLTLGIASGELPDLVILDGCGMASFIQLGLFGDISDADINWDEYMEGPMESTMLDGKHYGIPFATNCTALFYNKDLFDAAGVAYPEDGMTMAEYHELAAKMTSGEGNDKVYGAHVHTWPSNVYNYPNRTGKFNFTDPDTYANLTDYYNEILAMQDEGLVQDYGVLKSSNIHYSGVFYNQQAAMLQIGTWYINMLCENVKDFNWGVCALPNNDGIKNENSVGGVTPVSIGAYAKHPAEAWQFITFVCGEEGAETLAKCGIIPGYNSDKVGEIFDSLHDQYPNAPEGLSKYLGCENKLIEQPMDAKGKEIDSVFQEEHSAIMTKSITVEEGVKELTDRVKEVLAQ